MSSRRRLSAGDKIARALNLPGSCYGYARVSTLQQADEGLSLDVQQRQIEGHALVHGFTLDRIFVERGVSGSKPLADRPEGGALLALLKPGDTIITPKLDRMFRSAQNALDVLGDLKARGISLHMIDLGGDTTGNGVSKLVFTILAAVAENERERTRERVTETKADQRRQGRYLGGKCPWQCRVGNEGELIEIPERMAAIQRMQRLRAEGLTYRAIADAIGGVSYVTVRELLLAA